MREKCDTNLTSRAQKVWLDALVWYRAIALSRRRYELWRPGYEEDVALGDTEQEATETLETMIRHADLPSIAEEIAAVMIAHAEGRHPGSTRGSRVSTAGAKLELSRSSPRTRLGIGQSDELRDLIFDALPDGWTYNGAGWWSPPDAPQTVAQMRQELKELR